MAPYEIREVATMAGKGKKKTGAKAASKPKAPKKPKR